MAQFATISTWNVPRRRKLQMWNEAVSAVVGHSTADPFDEGTFQGELTALDLGAVRIAEIHGGASHVERHSREFGNASFMLHLVLDGVMTCSTGRARFEMHTGDFCLGACAVRTEILLKQPVVQLAMCVQRDYLSRFISCPEAATEFAIPGSSPEGALVGRYLKDLWSNLRTQMSDSLRQRFTQIALQMVASAYSEHPAVHPIASIGTIKHRANLLAYIEAHLKDHDLTPHSIAAALDCTAGYVHRMFAGQSESIGRYVLKRRLEECQRALSDSMQIARSITEIALENGFNDMAHFSRVFRHQYGVSPREWRNRALMSLRRTLFDQSRVRG